MGSQLRDLLKVGRERLAEKKISAVDAELLLAHLLGITRMELHGKVIELDDEEFDRTSLEYTDLITERVSGRPTQ